MLPPSVLGDNCPWTPWPLASEVSGASFHSPRQSGFIPSAPGWAVREAVRVGFAGTWLQIGGGESRGPRWARGWCWWGSQGHSIRGVMRPRSQVQASGHCIRSPCRDFSVWGRSPRTWGLPGCEGRRSRWPCLLAGTASQRPRALFRRTAGFSQGASPAPGP